MVLVWLRCLYLFEIGWLVRPNNFVVNIAHILKGKRTRCVNIAESSAWQNTLIRSRCAYSPIATGDCYRLIRYVYADRVYSSNCACALCNIDVWHARFHEYGRVSFTRINKRKWKKKKLNKTSAETRIYRCVCICEKWVNRLRAILSMSLAWWPYVPVAMMMFPWRYSYLNWNW